MDALAVLRMGDADRLRDLLKTRPETVHERFTHHETLLIVAARHDRVIEVEMLLEQGADTEAADVSGETALHWTAKLGFVRVAKVLANHNANLNAANADGWRPVHFAACNGHSEFVDFLIAARADVTAQNDAGETALFMAAKNTHKTVLELLMASQRPADDDMAIYGDQTVIG